MTIIDPSSPALSDLERHFQSELSEIAKRVFRVPADDLSDYFNKIAEMPPLSRLLAMHQNPLELVASVTKVPVTSAHRAAYNELLKHKQSNSR